jgi:MoaA/NifB/PqqE/SkfB family radical SAM enzyme
MTLGIVSNSRKLLYNCQHILDARNGHPRPVMFLVSPTNRCQLACEFCLYGERDRREELSLDALVRFADESLAIGVKTWELTGGGEPLLHPHINELMSELHDRGFSVGLMTNGIALDFLTHPEFFKWIRISLHADNSRWPQLATAAKDLASRVKVTFAYTATQQNAGHLAAVCEWAEKYNLRVKIEPDWFRVDDLVFRRWLELELLGQDNVFLDPVMPCVERTDERCYMHLVKPFAYTDGWLYSCACAIESKRDVLPKFQLCRMNEIQEFYRTNILSIATDCPKCKYEDHNRLCRDILEPLDDPEFC